MRSRATVGTPLSAWPVTAPQKVECRSEQIIPEEENENIMMEVPWKSIKNNNNTKSAGGLESCVEDRPHPDFA